MYEQETSRRQVVETLIRVLLGLIIEFRSVLGYGLTRMAGCAAYGRENNDSRNWPRRPVNANLPSQQFLCVEQS